MILILRFFKDFKFKMKPDWLHLLEPCDLMQRLWIVPSLTNPYKSLIRTLWLYVCLTIFYTTRNIRKVLQESFPLRFF